MLRRTTRLTPKPSTMQQPLAELAVAMVNKQTDQGTRQASAKRVCDGAPRPQQHSNPSPHPAKPNQAKPNCACGQLVSKHQSLLLLIKPHVPQHKGAGNK